MTEGGDEIYVRYKSSPSLTEFRSVIRRESPVKLDWGAVYPCAPVDRSSIGDAFKPIAREVVFDIDMSDYNAFRFCCTDAKICERCWGLASLAVQVLDERLRVDFGFKHILWVYSGRRGVHAWIADKSARELTQQQRSSIVHYLQLSRVPMDGPSGGKLMRVSLPTKNLHPVVSKMFAQCRKFFLKYLEDQEILENDELTKMLVYLVEDMGLRRSLAAEIAKLRSKRVSTQTMWEQIEKHLRSAVAKGKDFNQSHPVEEIVMSYVFPVLDANVTTGVNHLLKSPFSLHPKTGRICVPINPQRPFEFDPFSVPTAATLAEEVNSAEARKAAAAAEADNTGDLDDEVRFRETTSLTPFVDFYVKSFLAPLQRSLRAEELAKAHGSVDVEDLAGSSSTGAGTR